MKLDVIHGIFIGVWITGISIHSNVYRGFCDTYFECVEIYTVIGAVGYLLYFIIPLIYERLRRWAHK